MAIGIARVMGFKLMKNFKSPYHAKSIREFWSRWHISLSTWFKDYLYIPLGGNRVSIGKWCFNIFLVFVISGLWHGANWTFIVWGTIHGVYFMFAEFTKKARLAISKFIGLNHFKWLNDGIQTLITFGLVSFAWIFFRAKTINTAFYIVKSIIFETGTDIYNLQHHLKANMNLGLIGNDLVIAILSIILLEIVHIIQKRYNIIQVIRNKSVILRWSVYYIFLIVLVMYGVTGSKQFIYFQF
jgi:D-alanyl-lipoteichoic acid acyltransferase DltB (MBOAT superfamily)